MPPTGESPVQHVYTRMVHSLLRPGAPSGGGEGQGRQMALPWPPLGGGGGLSRVWCYWSYEGYLCAAVRE